ncbi:hypothetical protein C0416_05525 [bacterium]|nr:hypothetical protein [bacterium]
MSEKDPRDKDGLFGYIPGYGRVPEYNIEKLLENNLPEMMGNIRRIADQQNQNGAFSPNITIVNDQLRAEFENLTEAQIALANNVKGLGLIGQRTLIETQLQTQELQYLNEQAQAAYHQRNQAFEALKIIIFSLYQVSRQLELQRAETHIQTERTITGMQDISKVLSREGELERQVIEQGFTGLQKSITGMQESISYDIRELKNATVIELQNVQDMSFYQHTEQMKVLKQIRDAIENRDIKKLIILARVKMQDKDFESALNILEIAKQSDFLNTEVWYELAICSMHIESHEKALDYAKCVIKLAMKGHKKEYAIRLAHNPLFQPILNELISFIDGKKP